MIEGLPAEPAVVSAKSKAAFDLCFSMVIYAVVVAIFFSLPSIAHDHVADLSPNAAAVITVLGSSDVDGPASEQDCMPSSTCHSLWASPFITAFAPGAEGEPIATADRRIDGQMPGPDLPPPKR